MLFMVGGISLHDRLWTGNLYAFNSYCLLILSLLLRRVLTKWGVSMMAPTLANVAAIKWMPSSGVEIKMHPSPQFSNWSDSVNCLLLKSAGTCLQALSQDMTKAI